MASNVYTLAQYKTWTRNRLDDDSYDASILTQFANDTNREIATTERWPFMETFFAGTLTVGVATYDFQDDCQVPVDVILTDPDNNAVPIRYVPYELFDRAFPDPSALTTAPPTVWTSFGRTWQLGPAGPDLEYTVLQRYIKLPKTLADDADTLDVPDEYAELVVLGMYRRALMSNDQFDQAQLIAQEYDVALQRMRLRLLTRQTGQALRIGTTRSMARFNDPYGRFDR